MRSREIIVEIRRPKSRMELRRERRWRIAENVLNVVIGLLSIALAMWCGWLVGSGAVVIGI